MSLQKNIRDLIHFYVKTNYEAYLTNNRLKTIPNDQIEGVVRQLYNERREHLKGFVKASLKKMMKDDYPGDLVILNVLVSVFEDDEYCINRLVKEIKLYQQGVLGERYDHS